MNDKDMLSLWQEPFASRIEAHEILDLDFVYDKMDVLKYEIIEKIRKEKNLQLLQEIMNSFDAKR